MSHYDDDQKIYRTFEEFEREELRRDTSSVSVDEILDKMFADGEELDFDSRVSRRSKRDEEDDEE